MRRPLAPETPIDTRRLNRWISSFGSYRTGITKLTVESWLEQFKGSDRDIAARILDAIEYYGQSQIHEAFRQALNGLNGWDVSPKKRKGRWRFAAMSGSAGESGDSLLHNFRIANNLDGNNFHELFVSRSDFLRENLAADDTVVLIDDFSGTGSQVCEAWTDPQVAFGELLAGVGKIYLILVAASKVARKKISKETPICPVPAYELNESDDIFSDHCKFYSKEERSSLLHYCTIADKQQPKGFGDCGFIVVFQHRTPDNSIPILHADNSKWTGLFPRHG